MDHASEVPDLSFHLLDEITDGFSPDRILGIGSFGKVYMGEQRDGKKIAVKVLHDMVALDEKQFINEYNNLTKLKHHNIVRLVGYCQENRKVHVHYEGRLVLAEEIKRVLCFEYLHNGSLDKYLFDEHHGQDWNTCYVIIKGICNGLKYLHEDLEAPMYHLDLKPANILLDENMEPKIADFGLSRLFGEERTRITTSSIGTLGYLPPEYIERNIISNKLDIYSLGVIVIKIMTGRSGYYKCFEMAPQQFIQLVQENWRTRLQKQTDFEEVKRCIEIALRCLQVDRSSRPTIGEIVFQLSETETVIHNLFTQLPHRLRNDTVALDHSTNVRVSGDKRQGNDPWLSMQQDPLSKLTTSSRFKVNPSRERERSEKELGRSGSMDKYEPVSEVASGNFGVAKLMKNKDTRELVTMKLIKRGYRIDENVFREIMNHRSLRHPNIIRFKEVVLTPTHLGIVMEYAAGGDLFEHICNTGRFHEDKARYFFQQLVCGVSFCHAMQICHRDLKLENTLLDGSPVPRLKISEFRYSKSSVLHSRPSSTVGTAAYIAPEVLSRREYDGKLADVWSCGVTLYVMLVGGYPFEDTNDPKNFRKTISRIMSALYKIPEYLHVSESCRHLLSRIFISDPRKRITMAEIKAHPWFLKNLPRQLNEEAQQAYYNRRHAETAASASSSTSANGVGVSGSKNGGVVAPDSVQRVEEIVKILQEAQTVPKPDKPVSGYGWGTGDASDEDDKQEEKEEEDYGKDEYDKTVREVHASGVLVDIAWLQM